MGSIFRTILRLPLLEPILRPITRFLVGTIAIPLFRLFLRNVIRLQDLDQELEKDLEQWFRGALVLLVATANMENALFGWLPERIMGEDAWIGMALRILLAVGVIEMMPDQELFAVIHPGPPKIEFKRLIPEIREKWKAILWGMFCKHLNRASPVFVIMTAIFRGTVGWVFYVLAITNYLIIGLVTSRDKAMDVLGEFDRQVAERRRQIIEDFELGPGSDNNEGGEASASSTNDNGREDASVASDANEERPVQP